MAEPDLRVDGAQLHRVLQVDFASAPLPASLDWLGI